MNDPPTRWAVGVTTAPRPRPTLERTLQGLRRAGWPECHVFDDARRAGAWANWIAALGTLLARHPRADAALHEGSRIQQEVARTLAGVVQVGEGNL